MTDINEIEAALREARKESGYSRMAYWSGQHGASLIATIRTLTEERDKLREALEEAIPYTLFASKCELGQLAAMERQDTPATDIVTKARAALAQVTVTGSEHFPSDAPVTTMME